MATITLSKSDHGRTVAVPVGSTIAIRLEENPSTGYRWAMESTGIAPLEAAGDSFDLAQPAQIGSGGNRTFRFRATRPGGATLTLRHWQPWSGEDSVTERFSVQVQVTG